MPKRAKATIGPRADDYITPGEIGAPTLRRRGKYHNRFTEVDGITFHSRKEALRYQELKLLEMAGEITELELQPRFAIRWPLDERVKICDYIADFRYYQNGRLTIEDVKGIRTGVYRLKKKLMQAAYKITILET